MSPHDTDPKVRAVRLLQEFSPVSRADMWKIGIAIVGAILGAGGAGTKWLLSEARNVAEAEGHVHALQISDVSNALHAHKLEAAQTHANISAEVQGVRDDVRALYRFQKTRQPERQLEAPVPTKIEVREPRDSGS